MRSGGSENSNAALIRAGRDPREVHSALLWVGQVGQLDLRNQMMKVFVVLALLVAAVAAQDPAGSWLSYTEYDAPGMC